MARNVAKLTRIAGVIKKELKTENVIRKKKKHLIIIRIYCCTKIVTIKYQVIRLLIREASILCLHI